LTPFELYGEYYLLSYKNGSGNADLSKFHNDGSYNSVWQHNWTTGWTTLTPFELYGEYYLLSYKNGSGNADLSKFHNDG
ncbi:hypothetical protein, partial [Rhizohabitans arisaemae]